MGYRIGFQCFETKEAATDFQMSVITPRITENGQLVHPIKNGQTWTFSGQPVNLSFGECDPIADFKAGATIASAIVAIMVTAFCTRFFVSFVLKSGEQ